jgi:hypothetical protein
MMEVRLSGMAGMVMNVEHESGYLINNRVARAGERVPERY